MASNLAKAVIGYLKERPKEKQFQWSEVWFSYFHPF